MVVRLQAAGLSLVQAKVEVLTASGQVVALAAAQDSIHNDVTLNLSNLDPNSSYYVRVTSNRTDVFGVGSYKLSIDGATAGSSGPAAAAIQQLAGSFGTFDAAATLTQTVSSVNQQIDYTVQVTPDLVSSANYFRVRAPLATSGQTIHLVASVAGLGLGNNLDVSVFDGSHNPLTSKVLTSVTDSMVIQLDNVQPEAEYYVRVNAAGNYNLTVDFTAKDIPFTLGSTGSVASTQSATLNVTQSQEVQFVLAASEGNVPSI